MAKRLSDDNPCKGCGARQSSHCFCQASPKQVAAMARKRVKDRERYAKRMASEEPFPPRLCKSEACRMKGTIHPGKHERAVKLEAPWAEVLRKWVSAEHCAKNRDCMLLNGHSRPDCFTYADDADLARFRAMGPHEPSVFQNCDHRAYVVCKLPEGHEGPHQGHEILGANTMSADYLNNLANVIQGKKVLS